MQKFTYIHNDILFSCKKGGDPATCNNMDLEDIMLSKIQVNKNYMMPFICAI